jgi:ADP-L-glycero-D-manno-heptose 6-epimerase
LYSKSKLIADQFLKENIRKAPIIGLRYFNVYGSNEDHKLNMASPVHTFFKQIKSEGICKIFKQFNGYGKGEHSRDFISVKDCCLNKHMVNEKKNSESNNTKFRN